MIVSVDERKHIEDSEGVVESAAGYWLAGSNWNIEDLEAYRLFSNIIMKVLGDAYRERSSQPGHID